MKSLIFIVISIALLPLKPDFGQEVETLALLAILVAAFVGILLHLLLARQDNWVRIDTLFLLGFVIVNFQWPAMIIAGQMYPLNWRFDALLDKHLMLTTWLATNYMLGWMAGYWLPLKRPRKFVEKVGSSTAVTVVTFLAFLGFIVSAGAGYIGREIYTEAIAGVGLTGTVGGLTAYIYAIYQVLVLVLISWFIHGLRRELRDGVAITRAIATWKNLTPLFLFLIGIAYFGIAGERGQVLQILCALAIGYGASVKPIRFIQFASAVVAGSIIMTYLRFWRTGYAEALGDSEVIYGAWSYSENLANSLYATFIGLQLVEVNGGVFYGSLWVSNILGAVPFMQSTFVALTGLTIEQISGPAAITSYALGADATTGLGTTLVGDLYMNTGIFMSLLLCVGYGHLSRRFQLFLADDSGFTRFVAAIIFGSLSFYVPRASLFTQLQPVLWGVVATVILARVRVSMSRRTE